MDKILLIKIVYSAASIQGVFLAFLLFGTKVNQPANKILAIFLLFISFHLILVGFDEREFFLAFPHLSRLSWVIGTLYGPFILLFVQQITNFKITPPWKNIVFFIPFFFVLIALLPYFTQSTEDKLNYLNKFAEASQDDFGWINQFVSVMHIVFCVGNLLYYLRWEKRQSEEFSFIEAVRIKWLRQFLIFILAITLFGVVVFFSRLWNISFLSDFYRFHFLGVVFLFYWLSYKALTVPVLFGIVGESASETVPVQSPKQFPMEPKIQKSEIEIGQLEDVFRKVKTTIEDHRLFLKSDLTLPQLSAAAGLPRNQVSQAINSIYKGNFFDFINDYRLEQFKRNAVDPSRSHLSLLGIALESGFSSKASFYSIFKKKTGITPSEFLERLREGVQTGPDV